MDFSHYIEHLYKTYLSENFFYRPIITARVNELGPPIKHQFLFTLIPFCVLPYILIIYILKRYKYTKLRSYAVIKDYCMMSSAIILASYMDVFNVTEHSVVPDFVSLISPIHTVLVLHMINPDFNVDYAMYAVTHLWKLALSAMFLFYMLVINHAPSDIIQAGRMFLYCINIATIITVGISLYSDIVRHIALKQRELHALRPGFWEIMNKGGFPRYQIAFLHIFHWGVYWALTFFTDVYFLCPLTFGFFCGLTSLMSLTAHNDYFFNSFVHLATLKKVKRLDKLPDNGHTRYRLEAMHLYG